MRLTVSPALERELVEYMYQYRANNYSAPDNRQTGLSARALWRTPIIMSHAFPIARACPHCSGMGYPPRQSWCHPCKGTGGDLIVGALTASHSFAPPLKLITQPLNRPREPRFPPGLVALPPFAKKEGGTNV